MGEKNKRVSGFWRRNWLSLAVIAVLVWTGVYHWHTFMLISPFLIIVLSFFLYLFVVKFFYDNRLSCENIFVELSEGGWMLIRIVARPGIVVWQKLGDGIDLLTQRLGVEQELVIAEKRKKKLEIELSQRALHAQLAQMPPVPQESLPLQMTSEKETIGEVPVSPEGDNVERVPPYAKYAPVLMEYLEQVRWERFTVTQAQLILHKRFGTAKLVLEELVHQRKLEYVTTGKRVAYRLTTNENDKQ